MTALAILAGLLVLAMLAPGLISHTLNLNWQSGSGGLLSKSVTLQGANENNRDEAIPAPSTNLLIPLAFTRAGLQSIYIFSDQNLTLKTNSSGSPQETITITALLPFVWYVGCGLANPFSGDVTALYVTLGGTTVANFSLRQLGN